MSHFKNVQLPFALFLLFLFAALFLNTALAEDNPYQTNPTTVNPIAPADPNQIPSPPPVNAGNTPSYQANTPPLDNSSNPAPASSATPATNNNVATSVITYEAKNVDAGQIASTLQTLYGNQVSIVTQQQQIIIRGNPAQLAEIQSLIGTLDVAPRQLLISVRQNVSLNDLKNVYHIGGAGGQVSSDSVTQSYTTNDRSPDGSQGEVQALEGQPARISLTQSVPLITGAGASLWAGPSVNYSYANLMSGFDVIARIVDNNALLDINTFNGNTIPNTYQNTSTGSQHTTLRVPLGQWALVAGTGVLDDNGTLMDSYQTGGRNNQPASATIIRVTLVGN